MNSKKIYDDTITMEKIKIVYNIEDNNIALRLCNLKTIIYQEKQKDMNIEELITFLESAMNYDDMQIWLIEKEMAREQISLQEKLNKFFEIKSTEDILRIYDVEQNYDQSNLNGISKQLKKTSSIINPKK